MKKLVALVLLLCSGIAFADISSRLNIRTEDGAVNSYPYRAKFTNGSVTDNGDGTVSISVIGSGSALQIPATAVAFGTSSNTVTGNLAWFTWDDVNHHLGIGFPSSQAELDVNGSIGFYSIYMHPTVYPSGGTVGNSVPHGLILTGGDISLESIFSNDNRAFPIKNTGSGAINVSANNGCTVEGVAYPGISVQPKEVVWAWYDHFATPVCNWKIISRYYVDPALLSSTAPFTAPQTFNGNVNLSSGVLCGTSAGTSGQFLTSGGAGGPCTWATGSAGKVIQYAMGVSTTSESTTATTFQTSLLKVSLGTLASASSKVLVQASVPCTVDDTFSIFLTFDRNGTNVAASYPHTALSLYNIFTGSGYSSTCTMLFLDSPGSTTAPTYTVLYDSEGGGRTVKVDLTGAGVITAMELAP